MPNETPRQEVVVTDIRMRFISMVAFMIKWAIASIPALLILTVVGVLTWGFIIGVVTTVAVGHKKSLQSLSESTSGKSVVTEVEKSDTAAYISKVIIKNVDVRKVDFLGRGVFGEISNTGDRTLKEVEITIFCLDENGKAIFEKTSHPVLVNQFSEDKVLKPDYSRRFNAILNDAPSDWDGKVSVKVTNIVFDAEH